MYRFVVISTGNTDWWLYSNISGGVRYLSGLWILTPSLASPRPPVSTLEPTLSTLDSSFSYSYIVCSSVHPSEVTFSTEG